MLALLILVLLICVLFISLVPSNASAEVKSETIPIEQYDDFYFSLQLKDGDQISWDWSASLTEKYGNNLVEFSIVDGATSEYLVMVSGKSSDKGSAMVWGSSTYVLIWENGDGDVDLTYSITYEPYTYEDPKDEEIDALKTEIFILEIEKYILELDYMLLEYELNETYDELSTARYELNQTEIELNSTQNELNETEDLLLLEEYLNQMYLEEILRLQDQLSSMYGQLIELQKNHTALETQLSEEKENSAQLDSDLSDAKSDPTKLFLGVFLGVLFAILVGFVVLIVGQNQKMLSLEINMAGEEEERKPQKKRTNKSAKATKKKSNRKKGRRK